MLKSIINEKTHVPIVLIGLPIEEFYTSIVSTISTNLCDIRISIKPSDRCNENINYNDIENIVFSYINLFFTEMGMSCIDGKIEIRCLRKAPEVSLFAMITMEVLKNILELKRIDYREILRTLSLFDEKLFKGASTYIRSLRCSYLYKSLCISKGFDEDIIFKYRPIEVDIVTEVGCLRIPCLCIRYSFDKYLMNYILKLFLYVISKLSSNLKEFKDIESETKDMIRLVYSIENVFVSYITNTKIDINTLYFIKPITNFNSISFYSTRL